MGVQQTLLEFGSVPYVANAVDFDGSNDYTVDNSVLTGGPVSGKFCGSVWFRVDGGDGTTRRLSGFHNSLQHTGFYIGLRGTNVIEMNVGDHFNISTITLRTTATFLAGASWNNVLFSYDLNQAAGARSLQLYINNVSDINIIDDSGAAGVLDWSTLIDSLNIGNLESGTTFWNGCLAESWYAPGVQIDFSNSANRAKFISGGVPVSLGLTGNTPTGTAPLMYFPNVAASVGTNAGTAANFGIVGAPAACSSHP